MTRPSRSLALAATLSALAFAFAASCGGGEISDVPGGAGGAGSPGTGGSGQEGGPLGGSSGGAQAGSAGSSAGGPGGSNNGGSAGSSSSGSAGASGGGTSGSAGASGAGGVGGAGLCPPSEIGPPPSCNDTPPPGLEECATCLCGNNACRTAYENCTSQAGCARIASCVFRCAAAGATDGFQACASLGNFTEQLAAGAVLQACSACEDQCVSGTP